MTSVFIWYCRNNSAASRFSAEGSARGFIRIRKGDESPDLEVLELLGLLEMLVVLAVLVSPDVPGVPGVPGAPTVLAVPAVFVCVGRVQLRANAEGLDPFCPRNRAQYRRIVAKFSVFFVGCKLLVFGLASTNRESRLGPGAGLTE